MVSSCPVCPATPDTALSLYGLVPYYYCYYYGPDLNPMFQGKKLISLAIFIFNQMIISHEETTKLTTKKQQTDHL